MNVIQRFLSRTFPWYRKRLALREHYKIAAEQTEIFKGIVYALPDSFSDYKAQVELIRFGRFGDHNFWPGFKTSVSSGPAEHMKRRKNFIISGIEIFFIPTGTYVPVEVFVSRNILFGIKIAGEFRLHEFDVNRINAAGAVTTPVQLPETAFDKFIKSLDEDIKEKINIDEMDEIELHNKTFFSFYDLEDGNCLAVDNEQNVYSMVHDARPIKKKMNISFRDILDQIAEGKFDAEQHLDHRYRSKNHETE